MTLQKGRATVVDVLPGSSAEEVGLRAGDVIADVNGHDVTGVPLTRIVQLVRGPAGTIVHLQILRGDTRIDLDIPRKKVAVNQVLWHMLPDTAVAHIWIQEFGDSTDAKLREAIEAARSAGARSLIVDVRGNPGGLRDQAVAVTSEFVKSGTVFIEQDRDGTRTKVPVEPGGSATNIPIVVLIDEGTASAAEIFAGAIKDHERGKLVGERTFGTGTVLEPFLLGDGSAVLLAVKEWFTPNGQQIWHKGIEPDIEAALPTGAIPLLPARERGLTAEALKKSKDRQLLRALEVLEKELGPKKAAAAIGENE
jgi:carboxyl-terminal processing protease